MRSRLVCVVAGTTVFISLISPSSFAQNSPRDLYERARMLDESNQNLREAIRLYGHVLSLSKDNRAMAANALYRIGILQTRLGKLAEAAQAFKTLVNQYPDQSDLVARAKARLIDLASLLDKPKEVRISTERAPVDRRLLASFRLPTGYDFTRPAIDQTGRRLYTFTMRIRPLASDAERKRAARRGLRQVYEPSTLVVIDLDTISILRTVPFRVFLGDVVFNPVNRMLYASATADGCVKVIDTRTLTESATIPLQGYPSGLAVNAQTNRIYATCQGFAGNDKMFVIDASTNTVAHRLDLEGIASLVVVNEATNRVYARVAEPPKIRVFDAETNQAAEDLPGLSVFTVDAINNRIYAAATLPNGTTDEMRVLDGTTHRTLGRMFAGQGGVSDVTLSADARFAYVCLGAQAQLAVVNTESFTEITRQLIHQPRLVALDLRTGRIYLTHPAQQDSSMVLDVANADSISTEPPKVFSDDFESEPLAAEWTAFAGPGRFSLSEAPGNLRFKVEPTTISQNRLTITRPFSGDQWTIEVRASYFMGATGGWRHLAFKIVFGVPGSHFARKPLDSIEVRRTRGDWNDCCPGLLDVSFLRPGISHLQYQTLPNNEDTYVWRIKRDRRTVTVERSDDGISFVQIAAHLLGPEVEGVIQYFCITGESHANKDAYADFDYVRLTRLSEPKR